METLWAFLGDPENRAILAWLGGGIVAAAGGLWAVVKLFFPRSSGGSPTPGTVIKADRGGIAAGRDVNLAEPIKQKRR